jgi:hypothetical protein
VEVAQLAIGRSPRSCDEAPRDLMGTVQSFRSFDALRVKIRDEGLVKNKAVYVALALNQFLGSAVATHRPSESQLYARDQVGVRSQQLRLIAFIVLFHFVQDQRNSALASSCARAKQDPVSVPGRNALKERNAHRGSHAGSHSVAQRLQTYRMPYVTRYFWQCSCSGCHNPGIGSR